LLQDALEHAPAAAALLDGRTFRFRWSNPAFRHLLGEPSGPLDGLSCSDVFPGWETSSLKTLLHQVAAGRIPLAFPEYTYEGFPRGPVHWRLSLTPLAGPDPALPLDILFQACDVTDALLARRRADALAAELHDATERWELAARGTEDGIWDWDILNNRVYWSPRAKEMLGFRDHELPITRDAVRDLLHPDDRNAAWAGVQRQLAAPGDHYRAEYRLRHRDGSYRWVLARGLIVRDAAGKATRIVGSHVDITDRRREVTALQQAEARLRESEEYHRQFLENLPQMAWTCRADGHCDYLSPQWVAYAGGKESDYHGTRWQDIIHPDDRPAVARAWSDAVAGIRPYDVEYRLRAGNGSYRWFRARGALFRDAHGQPVRWFGTTTDVHDQRIALEQLRISEARFRLFAESGVMGIVFSHPDGGITYANDEYLRIIGRSRRELDEGQVRWDTITPPEWLPHDHKAIAQAAQRGQCAPYEKEYLRPDGSRIPVLIGFVMGGPQRTDCTAFVLDLSEQKKTLAALQESQRQLQVALDAGHMGIWEWRIRENTVSWSPTLEKLHGMAPGTFPGTLDAVLADMHDDDKPGLFAAIEKALADKSEYHVAYRFTSRDGQQIWVEAHGIVICDASGTPERMVGVCADATDRRRTDEALRASEGRLQVALDAADLALWDVHLPTGEITESDRLIALFGLPPGTRHKNISEWGRFVHPDDAQRLAESYQHAIDGHGDYVAEHRLLAANGKTRWVSSRGRVVRSPAGAPLHMVGVTSDITAQRLAQEDLQRAKETAEAANSAKDRFLAVLSHELRTPLTPVVMTLAALDMDKNLPAPLRQDLALIRRNIELETQLIDDLLDVTRIANGKLRLTPRPIHVHELLEHVCTICSPDAQAKHITLACDLHAPADEVNADPARLQQVFWNLVKNAIKFTPDGGRVDVLTRPADDQHLEVCVRDTGVGIAPDIKDRIFNAFEQGEQTVTRTFGGLGLGLAISKAIVDLHGGKIWADSHGRGTGAAFHVHLPVRTGSPADASGPQPSPADAGPQSPAPPLRVLLVEDHPDTIRVMERLLTALGMRVTTAGSVESALDALRAADVDLLISDIGLPDGTGHDLVMNAHRLRPGLSAIALSGFGMDADLRRSAQAGFQAHLTKPISLDRLQAAIHAATRGP
jgi:PAS domain S-box-containing protein